MKNLSYKIGLLVSIWLIPSFGFAQEELVPEAEKMLFSDMMSLMLAVLVVIIAITAIFAIYKSLDLMVRLRELKIYKEHGLDEYLTEKKSNEGSWFKRFSKSMTAAVPVEREGDILMDHNYDGIRE